MIIKKISPDLVFMTGDFVNFQENEIDKISFEMKQIEAEYGVFACLGNHDHYMFPKEHEIFKSKIRSYGIDLLVNENRTLDIRGNKIQIAGSDNSSWRHNFADFDKTLAGLSKAYPTIMMCHDPSNWDLHINGKRNVDLMLSGHTHGGQFGYNVFGYDLSPVRMFYKQWAGLYKSKDQYLYVNRGLGVVGPPVRIGINPEITHIVLRSPVNTASL
jgi:predicted MPP superfamily phosphohydrolase